MEELYETLKKNNKKKMYLFKKGCFYVFIGEDAIKVNKYIGLKLTTFSKKYDKCGFPLNRLNDYLDVFKNNKWDVEVLEDSNYVKKLVSVDIDSLSREEAINILKEIKAFMN